MGLSQEKLAILCAESALGEVCQVSQRLFADGFLVGGSAEAVERLVQRARAEEGCKQVLRLKPAGAFNTKLMETAQEKLLDFLQGLQPSMQPPRLDVYMSCGKKVSAGTASSELIKLLANELT